MLFQCFNKFNILSMSFGLTLIMSTSVEFEYEFQFVIDDEFECYHDSYNIWVSIWVWFWAHAYEFWFEFELEFHFDFEFPIHCFCMSFRYSFCMSFSFGDVLVISRLQNRIFGEDFMEKNGYGTGTLAVFWGLFYSCFLSRKIHASFSPIQIEDFQLNCLPNHIEDCPWKILHLVRKILKLINFCVADKQRTCNYPISFRIQLFHYGIILLFWQSFRSWN